MIRGDAADSAELAEAVDTVSAWPLRCAAES
jgi:hypothetical protein